jgi:hypothetical protein
MAAIFCTCHSLPGQASEGVAALLDCCFSLAHRAGRKKMTIQAPAMHWPRELREQGPEADPAILLVGQAMVAGKAFKIAALRMRREGRGPDFREDIPENEYAVSLESMTEDVEDLVDSIQPSLIAMNGGHYLLWMVPEADP